MFCVVWYTPYLVGRYKTWTLDSGMDHGLEYGLDYGLDFGLDSVLVLPFKEEYEC